MATSYVDKMVDERSKRTSHSFSVDMTESNEVYLELGAEKDAIHMEKTNSNTRLFIVGFAFICLIVLILAPIFHPSHYDAQKCLAIVVFVAILWSTEAVPLWITSITIPLLAVILGILNDLDTKGAAAKLLGDLMSPTVVLILGGFTIARALNKFHLDKRLAVVVLSHAGKNIKYFLMAIMLLGAFLSMWVSNVAAPVLMVFLVAPVLTNVSLPVAKCVAMGIALSCDVGGMLTPISSPQNAVSLGFINTDENVHETINFIDWIGGSIIIGALGILFIWAFLLAYYKPDNKPLPKIEIDGVSKLTWKHWYILFITFLTVGLWCAFQGIEHIFGELGVIALIPVICLFGFGILDTDDLKAIDWQILLLLGGGTALGDAVSASGLLDLVASGIQSVSTNVFEIFAVFCLVTMIISNFISHTVASITIIQVVEKVGQQFGHARALTFGAVLCCSAAAALPVSGFPNVIAYSIKDGEGNRILQTKDYLVCGIPFQIFVYALVISIGWFLFKGFHF